MKYKAASLHPAYLATRDGFGDCTGLLDMRLSQTFSAHLVEAAFQRQVSNLYAVLMSCNTHQRYLRKDENVSTTLSAVPDHSSFHLLGRKQ